MTRSESTSTTTSDRSALTSRPLLSSTFTVTKVWPSSVLRSEDSGETFGLVRITDGRGKSFRGDLRGISFSGSDVAVAVGKQVILRSDDDGKSFQFVEVTGRDGRDLKVDLQDISFSTSASVTDGLTVGRNGTILRTDDGGRTFTEVDADVKAHLNGVTASAEAE
jgi:photosystem II stability/assembly factor-like uncharacterized protein